jgi:hypothetical protein
VDRNGQGGGRGGAREVGHAMKGISDEPIAVAQPRACSAQVLVAMGRKGRAVSA